MPVAGDSTLCAVGGDREEVNRMTLRAGSGGDTAVGGRALAPGTAQPCGLTLIRWWVTVTDAAWGCGGERLADGVVVNGDCDADGTPLGGLITTVDPASRRRAGAAVTSLRFGTGMVMSLVAMGIPSGTSRRRGVGVVGGTGADDVRATTAMEDALDSGSVPAAAGTAAGELPLAVITDHVRGCGAGSGGDDDISGCCVGATQAATVSDTLSSGNSAVSRSLSSRPSNHATSDDSSVNSAGVDLQPAGL